MDPLLWYKYHYLLWQWEGVGKQGQGCGCHLPPNCADIKDCICSRAENGHKKGSEEAYKISRLQRHCLHRVAKSPQLLGGAKPAGECIQLIKLSLNFSKYWKEIKMSGVPCMEHRKSAILLPFCFSRGLTAGTWYNSLITMQEAFAIALRHTLC